MKKVFQNWILALAAMFITIFAVEAQYDDVYYDPDTDDTYYQSSNDRNTSYQDEFAYYDDDEYSYYDDYDYHYTSRIRRFRRPYVGFGFYDPCYVDAFYYDPFYSSAWFPGNTIYFGFGGNDYWSFRRYRRWARWNRYNFGFNPISAYYAYNYCPPGWGFGWNNWNRPFFNSWNNYSYGYFNSIYFNSCPSPIINTYGVNNGWANSGETRPNGVVYGPRRTGTVTSSPRGVIKSGSQAQPVFKGNNPNRSTRDGDFLKDTPTSIRNNPAGNITKGGDTRTGTISKEVERATRPDKVSKRPVYKPNVDKGNYTARDQGQTDRVTRGNATSPSSDTYRPTRGNTGNQPSTYKPSSPDRSIRTDASRRIYTPKRDRSTAPRSTNPSSSYRPDKGNSSSKGYTPSTRRSTTPSRSYSPDRSNRRSYSPDRGSSSRSSRSYSPSRSSSPSRSYSPSRSSSSSRSYTPSRSSSSSRSSASPSRSSSRSSASPSRSSSSSSRSSGSRSSGSSRRGNN